MTSIEDYDDAAEHLLLHDNLPDDLQLPAFMLAMDLEYGSRSIARGRLRHFVVSYEHWRDLNTKLTPGYEADVMPVKERYERDIEWIASKLVFNPQNKKVEYYWKDNRIWYALPYVIAEILQREGAGWVTLEMVKEAQARLRK